MAKNNNETRANSAIDRAQTSLNDNTGAGVRETSDRVNTLTPRADADRTEIQDNFRGYAATGGLDQAGIDRLRATGFDSPSGSSSGGGGGGGTANAASSVNTPDYLNTFRELMNPTGGFDPTRLSSIQGDVTNLRNARSNYGATDRAIAGLEGFGSTGGITDADTANINRDSLTEIERTGGYDDAAKQNIRNRATRGSSAIYGALQDEMSRSRARNPYSIGLGGANFRLAREGAQQAGQAASDAEIGINADVVKNRLAAGMDLSNANLGLTTLRTGNQLSGMRNAGDLDTNRNTSVNNAIAQAAGLDLNTQGLINDTRARSAEGTSRDTLGRLNIDANERVGSGANAAMSDYYNRRLRSENEQAILGLTQRGREFGSSGLLDTYGTAPAELMHNQDLLRGYRSDLAGGNQGLVNSQVDLSNASTANSNSLWRSAAGVGGAVLPYLWPDRGDNPAGNGGRESGVYQGQDTSGSHPGIDQYPQSGPENGGDDGTTSSTWYPTPTGPNGPDDGADEFQNYSIAGDNRRRLDYMT